MTVMSYRDLAAFKAIARRADLLLLHAAPEDPEGLSDDQYEAAWESARCELGFDARFRARGHQ